MIYVVTEGKVVPFPDAVEAKPSGHGHVVHVIAEDGTIIGNFPMKSVRFWGTCLPELWKKMYDEQLRWAALPEEEKEKLKAEAREKRAGQGSK